MITGRECYQFCDVEVGGERYCGQMCDRAGWHKNHVCSDHLKVPRREVVAGANRTVPLGRLGVGGPGEGES